MRKTPYLPHQPPKGLAVLRIQLDAEQYKERKRERPDAVEDCHIMNERNSYYRRLCYQTDGVWIEVSGPKGAENYD